MQVWSCEHSWIDFRIPIDGDDHGDLDYLECNRCFHPLQPLPPLPPPGAKPRKKDPEPVNKAWDCAWCRLIVCTGCRDKYQASPRAA